MTRPSRYAHPSTRPPLHHFAVGSLRVERAYLWAPATVVLTESVASVSQAEGVSSAPTSGLYEHGPMADSSVLVGNLELRNVGLEAHAYLHRCVSRYDSLAERTVFMPRPRSSGPICPTPHDSENRTSVSDLAMGNATHTCGHDFFNAPYNSADAQQASYRRPR